MANTSTSVAGSPVSKLDKDTRIKLLEEELEELRHIQQNESTLRSSDLLEIEVLKEKLMKSDENVTKLQNELLQATNEIRANESLQEACDKDKSEMVNHQQQYQTLLKEKEETTTKNNDLKDILVQSQSEKREVSIKHVDELCQIKANYENQLIAANGAIAAHIEENQLLLTDKESLQIQIDKVHGELNKSLKMVKAKNDDVYKFGLKKIQLESMVSECNVKIKNLEANAAQLSDYEDKIKSLNEEINKLNQLNGSLKVQINDLTDENNELNNDYDSGVVELNSRIDELEKTIASQNEQLNSKQLASDDLRKALETEQNDLQQKQKQIEEIVEKLSLIESENQSLQEACNKAKTEMANHQQQYLTVLKDKDELEDELLQSLKEKREMSIKHADELCQIKENYENQLFAANTAFTITTSRTEPMQNDVNQEVDENLITSESEDGKSFECYICKRGCTTEWNLKIHMNAVHKGEKPFECEFCNRGFTQKGHLNVHISAVHKGEKPFECEFCNIRFSRNESLKRHISAVHKGEKPFECEFCNKGFARNEHLKGHISAVHKGEKPFECEFCNKGFARNEHLKRHMKTVHNSDQ